MTKTEWQETDRFPVSTDGSGLYTIIEETEYLEIDDELSHVFVRGQTRYRTTENHRVHKLGKKFTFNTPHGVLIAERMIEEKKMDPPKWKKAL